MTFSLQKVVKDGLSVLLRDHQEESERTEGPLLFVKGADGNAAPLHVDSDGALSVKGVISEAPPLGSTNRKRYLQGRLGTTGLDSGDTHMHVNGSVTPVVFKIEAHNDYDMMIQHLVLAIRDDAIKQKEWGDIILTTGFDLKLTEEGDVTYLLDKALTGAHAIIQTGGAHSFGVNAGASNTILNVGEFECSDRADDDVQLIIVDFGELIPPDGLRIGRQSGTKIEAIVNDDMTDLRCMYATVYGHKLYP